MTVPFHSFRIYVSRVPSLYNFRYYNNKKRQTIHYKPQHSPKNNNLQPNQTKMKFTITALLGLSALLATAAPVDEQIKRLPIKRQAASTGLSSGYAAPTGTAYSTGALYPTGTAAPYPLSTGTSCSPNGAVVCSGPSQFGICNWGKVTFGPVAAGTKCVGGEIVMA